MSSFVEQLPHLDLDDDQKTRLLNYLNDEISRAESERQGHIDGLKEELEAYEAEPVRDKATPWVGAASLTVPVIASMVDATFPRLHSTIFGASTIVSIEELDGDYADHVKAWEDALNWSMYNELEMPTISNDWILEDVIHGTSVTKLSWERVEREILEYDDNDEITSTKKVVEKNQPVFSHITSENFYVPFTATTMQKAPWVAEKFRTTWADIKINEEIGLYQDVDALNEGDTEVESPEVEAFRESMEDRVPLVTDEHELFEVWVNFDLKGDGIPQKLLVTYSYRNNAILRVQVHPYKHRQWPFFKIVYTPRHGRFYGQGLARQLMPIQEEITAIHRQRLDNGTVANSRMWTVIANSRADQSFESVAPGLKIKVDSLDEIAALPIGDVATSSFENENMALRYAQQRSGISDFMTSGDVGTSGRATATQVVTMLQEQRTRFNWSLDQIRTNTVAIAIQLTELYSQFGSDAIDRFGPILGDERAQLVKELLTIPNVGSVMKVSVTASSASVNRAVEQQNLIGLLQIVKQITTEFEMPLVQLILNPQSPQQLKDYAFSKLEGMRALERRIFEVNDVRNTAEVLGSTESIREAAETPPPPPQIPGPIQPGGASPIAGAGPVPGVVPGGASPGGPVGNVG